MDLYPGTSRTLGSDEILSPILQNDEDITCLGHQLPVARTFAMNRLSSLNSRRPPNRVTKVRRSHNRASK